MRTTTQALLKVEVYSNGNVSGIAFTGKRSESVYTGKEDSDKISFLLFCYFHNQKDKFFFYIKRALVDVELSIFHLCPSRD